MRYSKIFESTIGCKNNDEVFDFLIENLKDTIKSWDYFVAWNKISNNVKKVELHLNILNYLIGKDNIEEEFRNLLSKYPEITSTLPILIATREKTIKVIDPVEENIFNYKIFSFSENHNLNPDEIDAIVEFASNTGLLSIFKDQQIKNLVDYVFGIEVGLDTNARKNRTGNAMEKIVELLIEDLSKKNNYKYLKHANVEMIKNSFGVAIPTDRSDRSFDFVIYNGTKLYLIETNFYSGGGSKLKAVAGEFSSLFAFIRANSPNLGFIWITDGKGWSDSKKPLREAFDKTDYILNLSMIQKGILSDIILEGL